MLWHERNPGGNMVSAGTAWPSATPVDIASRPTAMATARRTNGSRIAGLSWFTNMNSIPEGGAVLMSRDESLPTTTAP